MMKAQGMEGLFVVPEGRTQAVRARLRRAGAEASEWEMRHHNALLEETVRQRTAELEQTNARLQESLKQHEASSAQEQHTARAA
ncbi:MAG TPA: hypothetical protein VEZ71_15690 [Archangium sp.]|nr:hypothetical protein [Archangium sp.]